MYKYIEISYEDGPLYARIEVTGKSARAIALIEDKVADDLEGGAFEIEVITSDSPLKIVSYV